MLNYLNCLKSETFSNEEICEYISLLTSCLYNKSRALIEINFNKNYNESINLLQESIKQCLKHNNLKWKISFLDRIFRVLNKIVTDYCNNNRNTNDKNIMMEEFALRSQSLYCLLKQNKLITKKQSNMLSFWDITHQYIRYVKNRFNQIDVIRFQKMIIELWLKYQTSSTSQKENNLNFINFCMDYIMSIGECSANLKIEILSKIIQQFYKYIENMDKEIEYKIIVNIINAISSSQITLKHDTQHCNIEYIIKIWTKLYSLLQDNFNLFTNCKDAQLWKLLAKSIRYLPNLIRYIDDTYSFKKHDESNEEMISLIKNISLNTEKLFNIWQHCNNKEISKEKLKNANHRLFDTLITILSILQRYFIEFDDKNVEILNVNDIVKLLSVTNKYLLNNNNVLSDPQILKAFATKGYNIAVQIYNKQNHYDHVLNIAEMIENSCLKFGETDLAQKCHKIYESATFKCDNMQTVYYKMAKNIANCLPQTTKNQDVDISKSFKYLKLLVKYQTHSRNKNKFNNTSCISLIDLLKNVGVDIDNLDENVIIKLLSEQLKLYQSSFSYNTTIQQIEILQLLLKNYFFNQKSIQRSIALIDLAKLIRISKPSQIPQTTSTPRKQLRNRGNLNDLDDRSDNIEELFASQLNLDNLSSSDSFDIEDTENVDPNIETYGDDYYDGDDEESVRLQNRNPLTLLEEAIDLLTQVRKCGVDDDEKHLEMIIDDILATAHLWIAICKRESYATQKAIESQMDDLNQSMLALGLDTKDNNNNKDNEDKIGLQSMLHAMDIWSNLITKHCKTKCKHLSKNVKNDDIENCNKCHGCFRNLFSTIQHLQIMLDYMHLNGFIAKEIFILDRMIRLLSTMSDTLEWCREYRLLCLCWSAMAYFKFGNSGQSQKIFGELEDILLPTTPDISIHVYNYIKIIYAKYQVMMNKKEGIKTLLTMKQDFEKEKCNKLWEEMYLLAKVKYVLAELQIKSPQLFELDNNHFSVDIEPTSLAKDALIKFISLVDKLNHQFVFKGNKDNDKHKKHSSSYNSFVNSLPNKKYEFFQASSQQYLSRHHPQKAIHGSHTKMLFHYPSEFRLIAEFLECIEILGKNELIIHEPSISFYQYQNGNKAANNLVVYHRQKQFLINLMRLQSKKNDWEKYDEYFKSYKEISSLSFIKLSSSLTRKMYGSLSKVTPYATDYNSKMTEILSMECNADGMRYKKKYQSAINEYRQCLSIIQSLFEAKPIKSTKKKPKTNKMDTKLKKLDFIPLLKLESAIKRKCAKCLLYLRDTESLRQSLDICFEILENKSILDDLAVAKTKLCIGQCLILQLESHQIIQIIWKGNDETDELQSILKQNMKQEMTNIEKCNVKMDISFATKYDTNHIAMILCARQNLIQCLLILIHLTTVNPELIKESSFALSYIYGHTNIQWTAMFLNMSQSVNTRQAGIKQYKKELYNIKQQWHEYKIAHKQHSRESSTSQSRSQSRNNSRENSIEPVRNPDDVNINDLTMSMKKLKLNKKKKRNIKFNQDDYLTNEEYNTLYTRFYHKLSMMRYHTIDEDFTDYYDHKYCYKILDAICKKFYSQTIDYLQHSWNCVSMEVDNLLQIMIISVINPGSSSRNIPTDIIIVDIPINRKINKNKTEIKDEEGEEDENENENDDGFLNSLYFDDNDNKYDKIMNEFNKFWIEAQESTHSGKECNVKNDIKIWWENRYKLDKKLKMILQEIESDILGIFRCIFIPNFRHKQSKKLINSSCDALVKAINDYLMKKTNNEYLSTCYNINNINDNNLISKSSKMMLFKKLLQLMLICHSKNTVNDDEIKYCISYIFCVSDNYLLNKLLDTVKQHITTIYKKFASKLNLKDFDPLILSIGDTLKHLPWENIPILQEILPSICRIPCLEFAALRVIEYNKYNKKNKLNYYYIINPKGDLKKTESRFNRLLNDEWIGIKNKIPTNDEFRNGLEKNDVFLYVGHNGGEEFVNCRKLQSFNIKSITFLMGCSSGLLKKKGNFQSNGITNYYMIASCPIIIANLWDVTDKDIDQFSCKILRKSILKQKIEIIDIPKAVNLSRSVCKMRYLNGAAPICYGIPFHLFNGIHV